MKIDCAIKSRRIQAVKLANALNTIEGVPVSDYAKELSQQWANGEISGEANAHGLRAGTNLICIEICFRFAGDT